MSSSGRVQVMDSHLFERQTRTSFTWLELKPHPYRIVSKSSLRTYVRLKNNMKKPVNAQDIRPAHVF